MNLKNTSNIHNYLIIDILMMNTKIFLIQLDLQKVNNVEWNLISSWLLFF
jgi:hypothetical protein